MRYTSKTDSLSPLVIFLCFQKTIIRGWVNHPTDSARSTQKNAPLQRQGPGKLSDIFFK